MRGLVLAFALLLALPVWAEDIVLGLSSDQVSINTNFDGSEILIFGAVKRDAPAPDEPRLQVIVTVAGPSERVTVRRKEKRFGIWVNVDAVEVDHAPSFYAVSTSTVLGLALSETEDQRHSVSIPRAIRSVGAPMNITDSESFSQALIRIKSASNQYQLNEGTVSVDEQTLFRTAIKLPAALTEGDYKTRIFLTRGGDVISKYETSIFVRKVGMERWLFRMSRESAFLYGLMSLAIAIAAGWGASAVFSAFRR
ncbi:TIGR02186 family protein [Sulfitobacter geojensis]|uniref:TIGR02186 family protein n=1 Tax=Sulfitobacter geojensis TaxID=1342299 RepID=A0AAE2VX92_9RHOB|nr:TIGR02186 family protein [Sulfitobacter geojensis]MBM1689093.1 TIGR02186 family protein [Sulfitobacter geojensis]MBM1693160.1 TIGR02186 family protein [Sulfitobacter geojensis]MBM1705326.1 TIGR02186 family protein [Sulfitobacter geojensis]MBM1709384.1 TIGR02186 family protein [Sulfitobacter geojensis]MBM1713449.1 TIGR02186 family protein [Sulfitobacter geojensis]